MKCGICLKTVYAKANSDATLRIATNLAQLPPPSSLNPVSRFYNFGLPQYIIKPFSMTLSQKLQFRQMGAFVYNTTTASKWASFQYTYGLS